MATKQTDYQKRYYANLDEHNAALHATAGIRTKTDARWFNCITETREEAIQLNEQLRKMWHDIEPEFNTDINASQAYVREMYAERRERKQHEREELERARLERAKISRVQNRAKKREYDRAKRLLNLKQRLNQQQNNNNNESKI